MYWYEEVSVTGRAAVLNMGNTVGASARDTVMMDTVTGGLLPAVVLPGGQPEPALTAVTLGCQVVRVPASHLECRVTSAQLPSTTLFLHVWVWVRARALLTSVSCLSTCSQLASEKSSVLQRDRQFGSRLYSESVIEVYMEGDTDISSSCMVQAHHHLQTTSPSSKAFPANSCDQSWAAAYSDTFLTIKMTFYCKWHSFLTALS